MRLAILLLCAACTGGVQPAPQPAESDTDTDADTDTDTDTDVDEEGFAGTVLALWTDQTEDAEPMGDLEVTAVFGEADVAHDLVFCALYGFCGELPAVGEQAEADWSVTPTGFDVGALVLGGADVPYHADRGSYGLYDADVPAYDASPRALQLSGLLGEHQVTAAMPASMGAVTPASSFLTEAPATMDITWEPGEGEVYLLVWGFSDFLLHLPDTGSATLDLESLGVAGYGGVLFLYRLHTEEHALDAHQLRVVTGAGKVWDLWPEGGE